MTLHLAHHLTEAPESGLMIVRGEPVPSTVGFHRGILSASTRDVDPRFASDLVAPLIEPTSAETRALKTHGLGILMSLGIHVAAVLLVIGYATTHDGSTDNPTEAISVEIVPTSVFESMQQAEAEDAAAQASSSPASVEEAEVEKAEIEPDRSPPVVEDEARPTEEPPAEVAEVEPERLPRDPVKPEEVKPEENALAGDPQSDETQVSKVEDDGLKIPPKTAEIPPKTTANAPEIPTETSEKLPFKPVESKPEEPRPTIKPKEARKPEPVKPAPSRSKETNLSMAAARGSSGSSAKARQSASQGSASSYKAVVRARVAANKPGGGSKSGSVTVVFGVSASGGVTFVRASGTPELANLVTSAVRRASPFPPPPPGADRSFEIRFNFQ